jgi:hypothetical protein
MEAPCSKPTCSRAMNRGGSIGGFQSRRDCGPKPGVARNELPRDRSRLSINPNGVAPSRRNPVGVDDFAGTLPGVGPRRGPTPGFGTESRWDSRGCVGRPPLRTGGSWRAALAQAPCSRTMNLGIPGGETPPSTAGGTPAATTPLTARFMIGIRDDIMPPMTYVVRRGVKEAMEAKADLLVLDMDTNGGRVDVTEEIIGIVGKFSTMTYVNAISPLLLAVGLIGIYMEFKTPGFGVPGSIAVAALLLYFAGGYIAGLSGIEWVAVFALGVILIGLELFFFPGTLVLGISGALLVLVSIFMAATDLYPGMPVVPSLPALELPVRNLGMAVLLTAAGIGALGWILPKTPAYHVLVSQATSGTVIRCGADAGTYEPSGPGRGCAVSVASRGQGAVWAGDSGCHRRRHDDRARDPRCDCGAQCPGGRGPAV